MAKPINNRKDILLVLLLSPGLSESFNEPITGRTRITKMVFLFKEEVLPLFGREFEVTNDNFYKFFPWAFGPFSKELYDDLFFFILQGFIHANTASENPLSEEAAEWQHWIHQSDMDDDSDDSFQQESFSLTKRGVEFTQALYDQLTRSQCDFLREFKKRTVQVPLRALLRYVYGNYPKMTENSLIKEEVLGYDRL